MIASGGMPPYIWSVSAGTLPPGLSLTSAGVISGTPTTGDAYNFTIQVSGSGGSATRSFSLTINNPPGVTSVPFEFTDRGGLSRLSAGTSASITIGHAIIQPNPGRTTPSGLAIFGCRQNNILVTEAGVPASPLLQSGRIYAEVNGAVNTGLAIANPNNQPATVSFFFTGPNGNFANGSTTVPANGQIAAFLNQSPFNGGSSVSGTFTFTSSVPIAVIALRGLTNERGEFLITTLPVADLNAFPAPGTIVFPHFADGGGLTTQILLVNPGDTLLTGTVQFLNQSGQAATVVANGQSSTTFAYSLPPRTSQKLATAGTASSILAGRGVRCRGAWQGRSASRTRRRHRVWRSSRSAMHE